MLCVWRKAWYVPLPFYLVFTAIEGTFFSATAEKVPTGGWFSLMIGAIYCSIMLIWYATLSYSHTPGHLPFLPLYI